MCVWSHDVLRKKDTPLRETPHTASRPSRGMNDDDCPVCFGPLATVVRCVLPCTHTLCLRCLLRLRTPVSCPLCRADLAALLPEPMPAPSLSLRPQLVPFHPLVAHMAARRATQRAVERGVPTVGPPGEEQFHLSPRPPSPVRALLLAGSLPDAR